VHILVRLIFCTLRDAADCVHLQAGSSFYLHLKIGLGAVETSPAISL